MPEPASKKSRIALIICLLKPKKGAKRHVYYTTISSITAEQAASTIKEGHEVTGDPAAASDSDLRA